MTRKDFQVIANALGHAGRDMDAKTFTTMVQVVAVHLREGNARFREDFLMDWAWEVRAGVRDIDGRKVASGDRERTGA